MSAPFQNELDLRVGRPEKSGAAGPSSGQTAVQTHTGSCLSMYAPAGTLSVEMSAAAMANTSGMLYGASNANAGATHPVLSALDMEAKYGPVVRVLGSGKRRRRAREAATSEHTCAPATAAAATELLTAGGGVNATRPIAVLPPDRHDLLGCAALQAKALASWRCCRSVPPAPPPSRQHPPLQRTTRRTPARLEEAARLQTAALNRSSPWTVVSAMCTAAWSSSASAATAMTLQLVLCCSHLWKISSLSWPPASLSRHDARGSSASLLNGPCPLTCEFW